MDVSNPSPGAPAIGSVALDDLAKDFAALETIIAETRLEDYEPYPWQKEFHDAGKDYPERMLMAANRVGKTESASAEVAYHLTGEYPDWWDGKRFDHPVLVWAGSVSNEASRDIVQKALIGGTGDAMGTGWIPKSKIVGKPAMRQAGVSDVVDTVKIRHRLGGASTLVTKTYEQGWRKWQGTAPHVVWLDEEPEEYRIFTESQTRVLTSKGIIMVTFTPLLGETDLVRYFASAKPGTYLKSATWDDAPHLSQDDKERLRNAYPDHEQESRTLGIPMMGEGKVFTVAESEIKCDPFEFPPHFVHICGIDFGIDHPAAAAWMAWDRDRDIIYVYDCYRRKDETAVYHASAIKTRGDWIPVAWPHDGMNREKSGGVTLADQYRDHGVNMLSMSARYDKDVGGGQPQEPIILDILERMKTGRFKVFSNLNLWFEEFRSYHRKDGRLVSVRDDILKATFYACMMRRYATPKVSRSHRVSVPQGITSRY